MDEILGQIILFVVGLIIEIGVPLFLSKDEQKRLVRLFGFIVIIIAVAWIGYAFGKSQAEKMPPPISRNVSQRFDFETGISDIISLDVCDAIPPTWYENCHNATSKLTLSGDSYTGSHSLGYQAELLPNVEQVYSVNIPIKPPARVDAVSANINIPGSVQPAKIWLLVRINGEDSWKLSEISNTGGGWIYLYLDLQKLYDASGLTISQKGIDEVDIDVFLPKALQQSKLVNIEVDDVALYFPSSTISDLP
jgi:hypothetical protein